MAQLSLRRQDLEDARRLLDQLDENTSDDPELSIEIASVWAGYLAATGDFIERSGRRRIHALEGSV
jgi:hypothetical protein